MEKVSVDSALIEKMEKDQGRIGEMVARERNSRRLTDKFLREQSVARGKAGLMNMMTIGATAEDRWLPWNGRVKTATAKQGKKETNRKRNKNAAASRRKNRR